ncbi:DinB family protein [Actinomadura flavalba]|uniref:DinB family protein n=1 Tax=Actinomadura flavalba TaxID=1120938 RepID=UPI00035C7F33|nr:DinB family protein [Actinomadura flavalba]
MTDSVAILRTYDEAWNRLRGRLDGLEDHEFFWEPVPDGWSLRPGPGGTWTIDGEGGGGPTPDPVPFTTIAWRLAHVGLTLVDFRERYFADRVIDLDDVTLPGSAQASITFVTEAYSQWRDDIDALPPEAWTSTIGEHFGPYQDDSTTDLVLHVLDEFVHHSAEVGVLRDLYLYRHAFKAD